MDDVLTTYLDHFGIQRNGSPRKQLREIVTAFSQLPYENITKIIKHAETGSAEKARRYPEEVIHNHIDWGSGGTCFSLTSALLHLVRGLGWKAEYILADRRYGQDTHSALMIWIDNVPHLLDPGFLIIDPVPVTAGETGIDTAFNRLLLEPEGRDGKLTLSTVNKNTKTYRLTYKIAPVDDGQFYKAWDASFDWDMMQYTLLTRTVENSQIYLRGSRIQIRSGESVQARDIARDALIPRISEEFRIQPAVVARALSILKHGG